MQASSPRISSGHSCLRVPRDPIRRRPCAWTTRLWETVLVEGWAVRLMSRWDSMCQEKMGTAGLETIFSVIPPRRLSGLDVSSDTYSKDFTVPFSDSLENNGEVNDKIHTSLCLLHRSVFSLSLRKFYICCVT